MKINIEPKNKSQKILIDYLEEHASDELKEKINNGVPVEKDGKQLINKKTLEGCLQYCCSEAKKMAEQGEISACVKDDFVFGWAMHYFEEDSIEGVLYNLDGTEYKPAKKETPKKTTTPKVTTKTTPKNPAEPQVAQSSFFDLIEEQPVTDTKPTIDEILDYNIDEDHDNDEDEPMSVEMQEALKHIEEEKPKTTTSPIYEQYLELRKQYPTAIILMRLGDFYEAFADNAVQVAEELDLTLTSRDFGLPERIAIIGFPYHASDTYFLKIHALHDMVVWENKDDVTFLPIKTKTQAHEKHWIDENTYVDENGEIHEVVNAIPEWISAVFKNNVVAR